MKTAYTNGLIYTGKELLKNNAVLVENGTIKAIVDPKYIPKEYLIYDLNGNNLAPAFVDLQIYGAGNSLFSAVTTVEAIQELYAYCLSGGTAHFMLTMATNTIEKFVEGLAVANCYVQNGGKGLLGVHLEGPYLNPEKKGAHVESCIKPATLEEIDYLLEKGQGLLKMMTIAPEVCDDEIIKYLISKDILVSAGHSNATYPEANRKIGLGISTATHLFNAMSPLQSREPGLVGAIYNHPSITASIVADGVHVDFAAVNISKKIMGDRLFLITDAVAENNHGAYQHVYKGDRFTLPDGTLSGSSLSMIKAVKNLVTHTDITVEEALRMASTYPARLLQDAKIGEIAEGNCADFVVFDEELNILQTIAG